MSAAAGDLSRAAGLRDEEIPFRVADFERHGLRPLATYGQNHWASLAVVASSYLPKAVQQLTRKLRRRKMDPAHPGQPMMFVLFALQKPETPPA